MAQFHLTAGHPSASGESFPLGSTSCHDGVNFSLFCKHGTSVELLLFDHVDDIEPAKVIALDPRQNKRHWKRWIDTALESPDDICYQSEASITLNGNIGSAVFDSCSYCEVIITPFFKMKLPIVSA